MKMILTMILVLTMLLGCSAALTEGEGITIIPIYETEPVSLDDVKLNVEAEIDGYGIFMPNEFSFSDWLGFYLKGHNEPSWNNNEWCYCSGNDAEFAILRVDITNIATAPRDFLANCEVKAVYDDVYEYAGWYYQLNYDNKTYDGSRYGEDNNRQNVRWVINAADNFPIGPMYTGHYVFGCALPNAVVNWKKPLKLIITIDGNEIIYNIRK